MVSDEAKTRGQQKELEKAEEPTSPKLSRTTTMAATAKVPRPITQWPVFMFV